ncbi:MAG: hypothetical protein IJW96_05620 [Clostridia bacterium]|nr:hypothetical protein [Clostridia bacterium]
MKKQLKTTNSKLDGFDKGMKIICILLYVLWNAFLVYCLVDAYQKDLAMDPNAEGVQIAAYGLTLALIVLIYGSIGNGVISLLALITMIVSMFNKSNPKRGSLILGNFLLFILPIVTEVAIVVIGKMFT